MASILVVDDDAPTCRAVALLLRAKGHEATCVTSGRDALALMGGQRPDLVVMDVLMPGLTGLEVLGRMAADDHTRGVPVVMYSALSDPAKVAEARKLGARDYVIKSGGFDALFPRIQQYLQ